MSALAERRTFIALDGLRGFAAASVIIDHLGLRVKPLNLSGGYLAVDLFFCLSGFVLAHAYEHRFKENMTGQVFMQRRIIRLYPLYILGTVLTGAAVLIGMKLMGERLSYTPLSLTASLLLALFMIPSVVKIIQQYSRLILRLGLSYWKS